MKSETLTPAEENLMQILWQLNDAYLKEIIESYPDPKPHQNTLSTYLKILVEKGFLSTVKEGRIYKYSVKIPIENYKKNVLEEFLNRYFKNNPKDLIAFLLQEKILKSTDLKSFMEEKKKKAKKDKEKKNKKSEIHQFLEQITSKKSKKKKKKNKKNK